MNIHFSFALNGLDPYQLQGTQLFVHSADLTVELLVNTFHLVRNTVRHFKPAMTAGFHVTVLNLFASFSQVISQKQRCTIHLSTNGIT